MLEVSKPAYKGIYTFAKFEISPYVSLFVGQMHA
jgi:hypothetical protein